LTSTVTPPADGSAAAWTFRRQDGPLGRLEEFVGATGHNAVVQLGGPGSKYATLTDSKGSYLAPGAGTYELYADGYGFANTKVTLSADTVKDITPGK
jgi:hypothetical protein